MREVEIGERRLSIHECHNAVDESSKSLTGGWVWDCALVLAHYLHQISTARGSEGVSGELVAAGGLSGKRIVELGAGTGLPGLTAAALGAAEVILTDRAALLPLLRTNAAANGLQDKVRIEELEWGGDCDKVAAAGVDLVLCSDVMYDVEAMQSLGKTLLDLLRTRDSALAIVAYELRVGTTECFHVLERMGLRWSMVPSAELHPQWQSDDIGIFVMRRAPHA